MEKVQFDPTNREVQRDPYPHYRRLRDEAPVYLIKPLQAYALTRYEDCKNTFLHPELYSAKDFIEQAFGSIDWGVLDNETGVKGGRAKNATRGFHALATVPMKADTKHRVLFPYLVRGARSMPASR
jgi:hypothetical protein